MARERDKIGKKEEMRKERRRNREAREGRKMRFKNVLDVEEESKIR